MLNFILKRNDLQYVVDISFKCVFFFVADVDVPEPDEKSLITYVSSLYDVFPDVPSVEQSLQDNVSKS